jgi:Ca2+-binding RTX toxin-like protein
LAPLLVLGIAGLAVIGLTASNVVASSKASDTSRLVDVNEEKPAACNGITLTNVVVGANGTGAADLLLGNNTAQTMRGLNGNDCILGGGGNDSLRGNGGTDVCIGGPGADTFQATCETQIQ